jgi:hypothetical protein
MFFYHNRIYLYFTAWSELSIRRALTSDGRYNRVRFQIGKLVMTVLV